MGTPRRSSVPITARWGRRSAGVTEIPIWCRRIAISEITTLTACDSVVPSAAPTGPKWSAPMKK